VHVLRAYAREVVRPVCRELARGEPRGTLPRGMARLLMRHPAVLAEGARRHLHELLQRHAVLRRVVEDRESLQRLWNDIAANPARALLELRDWCRRAEDSGIGALQHFAQDLAPYAR
jgi:stearoyl-CoA desaturase (delta-9 desaturase)